jgi:phenylpyruvate tautomerase PptA (4-oxalocrotonate tautomerase family)
MPLVRIDVLNGWSPDDLRAISDAVQEAMVAELGVPERDRFHVISEHDANRFVFDRGYLDVPRSDRFVLVQVTLSAGRSTETKQGFYRRLCRLLVDGVALREEDLAVSLIENEREDWSFGRGLASYVVLPREEWR